MADFVDEKRGEIGARAKKMGIKHNYLYRVLSALAEAGKITKQGAAGIPRPPRRSLVHWCGRLTLRWVWALRASA